MRFEIPITFTTSRGAKTKGIVGGASAPNGPDLWVICDADKAEEAFAYVEKTVAVKDKRPLSGKSYVREYKITPEIRQERGGIAPINKLPKYKVGDNVVLHEPYGGFGSGSFKNGTICEVLGETQYCITLKGYSNPYVDFSAREFAVKA